MVQGIVTMAIGATAVATVAFAGGGQLVAPFTEEALARGIVYETAFPQTIGLYGFGSGFADLDNDGDPDIVLLGSPNGSVGIFENDGTGHFIDRTASSGIPALPKPSAFAAGDLDGDGRVDLYITQIDVGCKLFRSDGPFHFVDVTAGSGASTSGPAKAASLADFDGDGDLDIYVAVYRNATFAGANIPSSLFRNNGNGTFTDVAAANGLTKPAYTFTGAWTDIDLDGDPDLYLSNDRGYLGPFFQGNQLFRNDNGQLVEISAASGANVALFSMGLGVCDFDHNGLPDFYCTNIANVNQPTQGLNPLLLNQGNNVFIRGEQTWGIGLFKTSWGAEFFDFDDDGNQDLYVNNQFRNNARLRNGDAPLAIDVSLLAGCPGAREGYSYCSSAADIDGDGDYDLLVGDLGSNAFLYINHEGDERHSVRVRLVGEGKNMSAIGATAEAFLDTNSPPRFRDVFAGGRSYLGHDMAEIHVGLGTRTSLARLEVRWPKVSLSVATRTLTNLPADQLWTAYPPARLGDFDGDGAIGSIDRASFQICLTLGFVPGFEMMDMDGNSTIDGVDEFLLNQRASDFNHDGLVGAADLAVMLGAWGTRNPQFDLDDSGSIGAGDLAILLGCWN